MNEDRIRELARIAETYAIGGMLHDAITIAIAKGIQEFAAEAIADMVRPNEEDGDECIARVVAQRRIMDLMP